ncbi:hypothetical protein I3760_05G234500 [Carya illinoinensis]|nr:hypothetical protein I3760_05G234500 [Carya illinoinensis]
MAYGICRVPFGQLSKEKWYWKSLDYYRQADSGQTVGDIHNSYFACNPTSSTPTLRRTMQKSH